MNISIHYRVIVLYLLSSIMVIMIAFETTDVMADDKASTLCEKKLEIKPVEIAACKDGQSESADCKTNIKALSESASTLCAQSANLVKTKQGVPDSPAFAILGLKPETVVRPKTPEDLAVSFLNAIDAAGHGQQGFAVDFIPYLVFAGKSATLQDYQQSRWTRLFSNTQVSLAYAAGQNKADESRRFAFGVHITPWLADDPRMNRDHIVCLAKVATSALAKSSPVPELLPGQDEDALNEAQRLRLVDGAKDCRAVNESQHWDDSAWTVGITPAWKSLTGKADDLNFDGLALWSSLALKLGNRDAATDRGSLVAHVKYRLDEEIPGTASASAATDKQNSLILAGRYEFGRANFNFALETSYINVYRMLAQDDDYLQFAAGLNYRLLKSDFWLRGSVGRTSGRATADETVFGLTLAWGNNEIPLFN